jgi:hypothetical protein
MVVRLLLLLPFVLVWDYIRWGAVGRTAERVLRWLDGPRDYR